MKRILTLILTILVLLPSTASALSLEQKSLIDGGVRFFDIEQSNICDGNTPIVNGSVDRFLQVLAYQESSGNPKAEAGVTSASGKYQYIDSTWRARYEIYGPASAYARASQAPEEVQDAVAYIEYSKKFKDLENDLFKLAISHFLPEALQDESKLDIIPGRNSITPRQYANKLIQSIGRGVGKDIPLKYSQAPEFSVWLARAGGPSPTVNSGSVPINTLGACSTSGASTVGARIVEIAQQELAAGAKESDGSYLKYTGGVHAEWCAYFASWVLKEAGVPFENGPLPAVAGILAYAKNKNMFTAKGTSGFSPQPGDMVIYKEGKRPYPSHINIVISYDPSSAKVTTIGGNESSMIKQSSIEINSPAITGFMRIP